VPIQTLPFRYESTGVETFFTNRLDPDATARRVFCFHRPATLAQWLQQRSTLKGGCASPVRRTAPAWARPRSGPWKTWRPACGRGVSGR